MYLFMCKEYETKSFIKADQTTMKADQATAKADHNTVGCEAIERKGEYTANHTNRGSSRRFFFHGPQF